MFFREESMEDKGLFTFYREQAEREEEMRRNKKLRRQLKKMQQIQNTNEQIVMSPPKLLSPIKLNTIRKVFSMKQYSKKEKASHCKQRLVESIVDMGYHIQQQQYKLSLQKQRAELKLKQPSFVSRTKKCKQKLNELQNSLQHQKTIIRQDSLPEDLRIRSYEGKDQSADVMSSRMKPGIHSVRSSFELPDIPKSEQKIHYKPKKSIKSKIILQALKINDRDKIRNIRDQIATGRTTLQFPLSQQQPGNDYYGKSQNKAIQYGIFQPKGILSMLNRLKRRI